MAYMVMVYIVMAYIVMAYTVMAYIAMAYTVMAYIVMAPGQQATNGCEGGSAVGVWMQVGRMANSPNRDQKRPSGTMGQPAGQHYLGRQRHGQASQACEAAMVGRWRVLCCGRCSTAAVSCETLLHTPSTRARATTKRRATMAAPTARAPSTWQSYRAIAHGL